ncbi:MAG: sensor domain-containing diguanylate cyclase [Candidatus Coatesbacteria bacterium]
MGETEQDILLASLLLLGAALQYLLGGPWLLVVGAVAVGIRVNFSRDDRRGIVATAIACVLWIALHTSVTSMLTRLQVAIELGAFSAFVVVFWVARQINRERLLADETQLEDARKGGADMQAKLRQLRRDSEVMVWESEELTRLFGVTRSVGEVIREEEIVNVIRETAQAYLKLPAYVLLLARDEAIRVRAQTGFDDDTLADAAFPPGGGTLAAWFLRQREPVLVDDVSEDPRFAGAMFPYRSLVMLPMLVRDEPVGALVALDGHQRSFTRQDYTRAGILAKQLSLGIGKTLLYGQIEELSITDGLTKLYRHRHFQERFEIELERARRYSRPLSLLMGDLDQFKQFNDAYGHLEGDDVLKHVSRAMEANFQRPAILARYGGEEFAVLLPDTSRERAAELAEKFRAALEAAPMTAAPLAATPSSAPGPRPAVTMSIGVAAFPEDAQTRRDLIARADLALYRSKDAGRNRVTIFDAAWQNAPSG